MTIAAPCTVAWHLTRSSTSGLWGSFPVASDDSIFSLGDPEQLATQAARQLADRGRDVTNCAAITALRDWHADCFYEGMRSHHLLLLAGLLALGCAAPVGPGAGHEAGPFGKADHGDDQRGPRAALVYCEEGVQELVRAYAEQWWIARSDPDEIDGEYAELWGELASRRLVSGDSDRRFAWEAADDHAWTTLSVVPGDGTSGDFLIFEFGVRTEDPPMAAEATSFIETLEVDDVHFVHGDEVFSSCSDAELHAAPIAALGELASEGVLDVAIAWEHLEDFSVAQAELDLDLVWGGDPIGAPQSASTLKVVVEHDGRTAVLFDGSASGSEGTPNLSRIFDVSEAFGNAPAAGEWTLRITADAPEQPREATLHAASLRVLMR